MKILITKLTEKCEFKGCDRRATDLVGFREVRGMSSDVIVACYCEKHAYEKVGTIESVVCPNCECFFRENAGR